MATRHRHACSRQRSSSTTPPQLHHQQVSHISTFGSNPDTRVCVKGTNENEGYFPLPSSTWTGDEMLMRLGKMSSIQCWAQFFTFNYSIQQTSHATCLTIVHVILQYGTFFYNYSVKVVTRLRVLFIWKMKTILFCYILQNEKIISYLQNSIKTLYSLPCLNVYALALKITWH